MITKNKSNNIKTKEIPLKDKKSTTQQSTDNEDKDLCKETFVNKKKITDCLNALKKAQEHRFKNEIKKQLFEHEEEFVLVELVLKKIPENYSTFIHRYSLPHHWRKTMNYETCLIVPDVNKVPLIDRELDIEQTKSKYSALLEEADVDKLITEILPMRQLRNEFRPPALRKKLATTYDAFLCEKKLLQNKFNFLCRFIGKQFWIDAKNVPAMIDFKDKNSIHEQIESRLNEAAIYQSGKGSTISICVGTFVQESKHLIENILSTLSKVKEIYGNNVCALSLKTKKSMAITFYMDLGSPNEVDITRPIPEEEFAQDDFDFLTNSDVKVYKGGRIEIIKRKKCDDNGKEEEEVEEEFEDELEDELELIDRINNKERDNQWARQKVNAVETRKRRIKRGRQ